MSSRQIKNTRLVYNDEKNLKIYQALPAEEFKEFFMAYLTYNVGDNIEVTDFSSPSLYGLFMQFKDKIDYNEEKWERQAAAKRENGKKGGRPKKSAVQEDYKNVENPNNLENEIKAILSPENTTDDNLYIQDRESGLNSLKMAKNNEFEIEDNIDEINNKENSENMGQCLGTLDELKTKNQDIEVIMQNWFEDDDNVKMYNRWINALVQYKYNTTPENEEMALGADRKLNELCDILNIQNKNEYLDYVKEDIDYKIAITEKNQKIA